MRRSAMNIFFITILLLGFTPLFCMEKPSQQKALNITPREMLFLMLHTNPPFSLRPHRQSPQKLIEQNIEKPAFIQSELENYPDQELVSYRYGPHNNLIHATVEALIQKRRFR